MFNPLLDAIFSELCSGKVFKIHTLTTQLKQQGVLPTLDEDPNKELFKRNFLVMNALFQLQDQLQASKYYLHVESMHIHLKGEVGNQLTIDSPLKSYYLDWNNYHTSKQEIDQLLDQFWQKFIHFQSTQPLSAQDLQDLCSTWGLSFPFTIKQLTKIWRKRALAYHPDRNPTGGEAFKQLHQEYLQLKSAAKY